jgi:hypothetical protein
MTTRVPYQLLSSDAQTALTGFRNKLINGDMRVAQRGVITSTTALTTGAFTADRWRAVGVVTTAAATYVQGNSAPNSDFQYNSAVEISTADTSITSTKAAWIEQGVEGFHARDLIGKPITISFWVRSAKTGTHCVALRNSGSDRSYVATYTVSAVNVWEYKVITVPVGLITAGTWNWTNGLGFYLRFVLAAGDSFHTTAGAWQTGNFMATSTQVNCLDAISNIFAITGVQLEAGTVATQFEHRPIGLELSLCQRYHEVATVYSASSGGTNRTDLTWVPWRAVKRADPVVAIVSASVNTGTNTLSSQGSTTGFSITGAGALLGDVSGSIEL